MTTSPPHTPQQDVINYLMRPDTYGDFVAAVKKIETHAALIFLVGSSAYKIKKSVVYPYLDFSTLEKRKAACETELEINQPHAPQIYLSTLPICRDGDGEFNLKGRGDIVEWALHMHRFADDALMANLIENNSVNPELYPALADEVIRYHHGAAKFIDNMSASRIEAIVVELCDAFYSANKVIDQNQIDRFCIDIKHQLECVRHRLVVRGQRGFVRRCHGDLHLQNIVVLEGKPILFDALEFDEDMATVDVLYDLAFLIMDLETHKRRNEANVVLNRFVAPNAANISGLQALPLFLACRAGIRAMVAITRAGQATTHGARKLASRQACEYFAAALKFLECNRPRLICVGGLSGTGKTSIGRQLAPHIGNAPGALHLRSDVERKILFGAPETQRLDKSLYTKKVSAEVYRRLKHKAKLALLAGSSVIVDAVFANKAERDDVEVIAKNAGASFDGVWLTASENSMLTRVKQRTNDASDADASVVKRQLKTTLGPIDWRQVCAEGKLNETAERCKKLLF